MSEPVTDAAAEPVDGSTIEWLELFFDLVVVAAVAVLTEGLREDPTFGGLGMFALLYGAVWLSWVSVVLYANVAQESTRVLIVVWSMFLVAVMAATSPAHFEHRANLFAIAFLLVRGTAARASMRTGRLLVSWPLQLGGLAAPWVVAMWVDPPWKFVLWGAGIVVDLTFVLLHGEADADHQMQRLRKRVTRNERAPVPERVRDLQVVDVDAAHLDERLGLFVIIVLGEAVSQIVVPAATTEWTAGLVRPAVAGFVILAGLWWLTFSYGFTAAPHTRLVGLPPRFALPIHLAATFGIVCLAGGLGEMASRPAEDLGEWLRWVMCGGLALHFLATGVSGLASGAPWRWLLGWALPCTVVPLVAAAVGALTNTATTLVLLTCVGWMIAYARVARAREV
jgi:low temperature requirement protein LtrA